MREAITLYLPWRLGAFTIVGMVMAGNKHRLSWAVGLLGQVFWLVWIMASESWGLLPSCLVLVVVYGRNHLKWSKPAAVSGAAS